MDKAIRNSVRLPINVNHRQTLAEMVAAGRYDMVDANINDIHFQLGVEEQKSLRVELLHLDRNSSSEKTIDAMAGCGVRPANIAEFLAFGATYPEFQREFPIIALGSIANVGGAIRVPSLIGSKSNRRLRLYRWDGGWVEQVRFLAVSIDTQSACAVSKPEAS